ncbi:MAG: hypothetical protein ACOC1O_04965, partial [bacterium]
QAPLFFILLENKECKKIRKIKILSFKIKDMEKKREKDIVNDKNKASDKVTDRKRQKRKKDKTRQNSKSLTSKFFSKIFNKKKSNFDFELFREFATRENINYIVKFIFDILRLIGPSRGGIKVAAGFEDPYYNGLLLGWYYSFKNIFYNLPVDINISWEKEVVEAEGELSGHIILVQLLWRIMDFLFSWRILKLGRKLWLAKKQNNLDESG